MVTRQTQLEDEALVLACRTGSRTAFQTLVERWQERLWRHALRLTGREDGAWDVLQETWMDVSQGIRRLADAGAFRAWIYQVTSRRALDWHRRRGGSPEDLGDVEPADVGHEPTDTEEAVRAAITQLSGTQRVALSLHYLEGFEITEVAEILGIPEGTVKSRLPPCAREAARDSREDTNMSEFSKLIKEMLLGDEPFDQERASRSLDAALKQYDRRLTTSRWLFLIATTAMTAAMVVMLVLLLSADPHLSTKLLIVYAAFFVVAMQGIGFMKNWFFNMNNHTVLLKELRRLEYRLMERE